MRNINIQVTGKLSGLPETHALHGMEVMKIEKNNKEYFLVIDSQKNIKWADECSFKGFYYYQEYEMKLSHTLKLSELSYLRTNNPKSRDYCNIDNTIDEINDGLENKITTLNPLERIHV